MQARLGAFELPEQGGIERQIARRGGVGLQVETAFDLAPIELRADQFAQPGLDLAQLFADAEAQVEVTRIDTSQLEMERTGPRSRLWTAKPVMLWIMVYSRKAGASRFTAPVANKTMPRKRES